MLTLRDVPPPPARRAARPRPRGRRPFRDNPVLIPASIALLVAALGGTLTFANRSSRFSPDFLTEFVLYALSVADLTMILALVFVLARNIIKMMVERRRGLPFARFRSKLVGVLLGMTLIPSVLVLARRQRADSDPTSIAGSTRRWRRSSRPPTGRRPTTTWSARSW